MYRLTAVHITRFITTAKLHLNRLQKEPLLGAVNLMVEADSLQQLQKQE
jgi:hypothetical protein